MEDCEENGEFCQFYREFFSFLDGLKESWWAESLWENSGNSGGDWRYNSQTGQWEQQKLPLEHVKFETVEPIISQILGDKDFFVPTSTPLHKKFFERFESFDFDSHFSYLKEEGSGGNDYEDYSGDYGDYRRRKRQVGPEDAKDTSESRDTTEEITTTTESATTTTEHYQETLNRDLDRFLDVMSRVTGFILTALNTTRREKREKPSLSKEERIVCYKLRDLPVRLSEIKDGNIFSLAKIKVASFLNEENVDLLDGITAQSAKDCLKINLRGDEVLKKKFLSVLEEKISELALFNTVKQYPDGLDSKRDDVCVVGEYNYQNNECKGRVQKIKLNISLQLIFETSFCLHFYLSKPSFPQCECHKKEKLAVYDIWASLHLIDNMDFTRGGDVWSWYYNEFFERLPFMSPSTPRVNKDIASEMISFEKEILSNLSGKDVKIGLSDFVSVMSQPERVWSSQFDFPRLYSLAKPIQSEIFSLFNYDDKLTVRTQQELQTPDFENFSLPSYCSGPESDQVRYCNLTKQLPDLRTTMAMMHLAKYPLEIHEDHLDSLTW